MQTPSFPAQVEQVIVDVVVTDKKGNADPRPQDKRIMTVIEDGVPQAGDDASRRSRCPTSRRPRPTEPPRISVNTDPAEQRGRTFVIVFDDTHITPWRANQAKAAVASFLEKGVRDGDRVTLVSTAGATWWTSRMPTGPARSCSTW